MKFSCSQNKLSKSLNIISKAISTRTTMPILKGILIDVEDGTLTLTASDLDISVIRKIKVDSIENGKIVVNAKIFIDIIRKLPSAEINFVVDDNQKMEIKCLNTDFEIICISPDEFPSIYRESFDDAISFHKETFKELIRRTQFAAHPDETRGIISGILLEMNNDYLKMVAIDGYRMAINKAITNIDDEQKFVIAARIMGELSKIINDSQDETDIIKIKKNGKSLAALIGNNEVNLRIIDGEFLQYNEMVPSESSIHVKVNRKSLSEAIERASIFTIEGQNNLIKLNIEEQMMKISSKSQEGSVVEEVMIEKTGGDIEIGFNAKYLIDILKVIDDDEIMLYFNSPVTPCVVTPIEGDEFLFLVLPVRVK